MLNPSQKMPTFNRGQALPADALNHVVEAVKRMIKEGKGIRVESIGDQIVIHAKGGPIPTGGGREDPAAPSNKGRYICPTVYSLPAVPTNGSTYQMVFWTSEDEPHDEGEEFQEGTGDDTVWWTRTSMTRWYPLTYSTLNGTPGSEELV